MTATVTKTRSKTNKELQALCKTHYKSLPITEVKNILKANGFDSTVMDGMYTGSQGKVHAQIGKNRWIVFTWYKMPSGKFEINAYVS
jgi:hypothetical protein